MYKLVLYCELNCIDWNAKVYSIQFILFISFSLSDSQLTLDFRYPISHNGYKTMNGCILLPYFLRFYYGIFSSWFILFFFSFIFFFYFFTMDSLWVNIRSFFLFVFVCVCMPFQPKVHWCVFSMILGIWGPDFIIILFSIHRLRIFETFHLNRKK